MRNGFVMESFGYLKIMKYGNYKNNFQDIPAGYDWIKKHILDETNHHIYNTFIIILHSLQKNGFSFTTE